MPLQTLAPGIHSVTADQGFFGLEVGTRMTVLALEDGLLLHSPVDCSPGLLAPLGTPRWLLAPNKFHHLHVGPWIDRGLEAWCAPGLVKKRPDLAFAGEVDRPGSPFGDEVLLYPLGCFSLSNEVVLLHRPSRTLVVTDLVFNIGPQMPWLTRAAMWTAGGFPGVKTTFLERLGMDRAQAREDLGQILALDFDRLVMAHGDVVETGGKQALGAAFDWLF